jgi:hypothetical protein
MDDAVRHARERERKIAGEMPVWARQKGATEAKLNQEHVAIRRAAGEREALLGRLVTTDADSAKRLHKQIDDLDDKIKTGERVAEALQRELRRIAETVELLSVESAECQRVIQQQEREQAFAVWVAQLKQRLRTTEEALAASRSGLGELNLLAERGSREFGGRAIDFMEPILNEFFTNQANSESRGWRPAIPAYRPMSIMVHPQVRR